MTTVYLHIGAPKTATSSLQALFAAQHETLLNQGLLYPSQLRHGDAHHLLACDLIDQFQNKKQKMPDFWYGDRPRGQAWQSLLEEIAEHTNLNSVFVSTELFFGQSDNLLDMLNYIKNKLANFDVKIIAYLRRQDLMHSSFYNQDVKGARQWPTSACEFYEQHQLFVRGYDALFEAWASVFGENNIIIRPFEQSQWRDGDLLKDVCHILNISLSGFELPKINDALGSNQVYIKRALNKVGFSKELNEQVIEQLFSLYQEKPTSNISYVSPRYYQKARKEWLQANNNITEKFLDGTPLFTETIPPFEKTKRHDYNKDSMASYINALCKQLESSHFNNAKLFARGAILLIGECDLWESVSQKQYSILLKHATS